MLLWWLSSLFKFSDAIFRLLAAEFRDKNQVKTPFDESFDRLSGSLSSKFFSLLHT